MVPLLVALTMGCPKQALMSLAVLVTSVATSELLLEALI